MDPIFCAHLIIYFGELNLDIIITSVLTLCNLCVICIKNRFHSFISELCTMIVRTLKMCTDDAGQEQSLVLFKIFLFEYKIISKSVVSLPNRLINSQFPRKEVVDTTVNGKKRV